jgi:hypothetical protein
MKMKVTTGAAIYSLVATVLYTALLIVFVALKRADKVSPTFANVFFWGGTLLIQTIPVVIAAAASMKIWRCLAENKWGTIPAVLLVVVGTLVAYAFSYFVTVMVFKGIIALFSS